MSDNVPHFERVFRKLKPTKHRYTIIGFDTEDNGDGAPDNFLCASFYAENETQIFYDRQEARNYLLAHKNKNTIFFAHNLQYDLNNLDYPEGDIKTLFIKSKLICGVYKYGEGSNAHKRTFLDTGNFFSGESIESLGKMIGIPKLDYPVENLKHKRLDDLPIQEKIKMGEYCLNDSKICYTVANYLQDLAIQNNTKLKCATAPSLAMRIFKTNFLENNMPLRSQLFNDIERLAYYGGRTEAYDFSIHKKVYYSDINSSYPTSMMQEIPYPCISHRLHGENWCNIRNKLGISLVRVKVPYMRIPPLPYRTEGKLIFPVGEWTAAYTHNELAMAERYGCIIKKVYDTIIYPKGYYPFKDYINKFYALKNSSVGIERNFYKLLLNSLYGKFGERTFETIRCKLDNIPKDKLIGYAIPDPDLSGWVSYQGDRRPDPKHAYPIIVAYITAYSRIKLYEEALSHQSAIYCDTDSCVSDSNLINNIGSELGQWKTDEYTNFKADAPKMYSYESKEKYQSRIKGVPRKATKDGEYYCFERPVKLGEAVRRRMKPNQWIPIRKKVLGLDTKRIKLPGGDSRPIFIDEPLSNIWCFEDMLNKEYEDISEIEGGYTHNSDNNDNSKNDINL